MHQSMHSRQFTSLISQLNLILIYKKTCKCFIGNTYILPLGVGLGLGLFLVIALLFFYRRHHRKKQKRASGKTLLNLSNLLYCTIESLLILIIKHQVEQKKMVWKKGFVYSQLKNSRQQPKTSIKEISLGEEDLVMSIRCQTS